MNRKKVLHISKYYPPYKGGIEDICKSIVEGLTEYDNKVFCYNDDLEDSYTNQNGIEIRRISTYFTLFSQPIAPFYKSKLKDVLDKFQPDLIHLHLPNPYAAYVVERLKPQATKLIIHWHSDIVSQKYIYPLFASIEKRILDLADCIFVTSPNYLENSKPLESYKNKCAIVPNGIYESKIDYIENSTTLKNIEELSQGKKIVFFMGRHVAYKGIEYLLEAEKHIKSDCVIFIAGNGPLSEELKSKNKSPRIHFLGEIADSEIGCYMRSSKVFAFPSITKNEAFGVVLAEAMYSYLPAITFTIEGSGVNWVNLHNITGIEVPNKDYKAFAKAIDQLLSNEDLRLAMAQNAHQRIKENFTTKRIAQIVNEEYAKLW